MKKETKAIITELKNLVGDARKNIYRRCQLAWKLFQPTNRDWIGEMCDGEQSAAEAHVQSEFFPDLGGYVDLQTLIAIYEQFPDEAKWIEYGHNLQAMELLMAKAQKAAASEAGGEEKPKRERPSAVALRERDEKIAELTVKIEELSARLENAESEKANLHETIRVLNAALRSRDSVEAAA